MEYSVAGYPWRKAEREGKEITTPLSSWGGLEATSREYERNAFNRKEHIAVRFHRERIIHLGRLEQEVAPMPQGMSGGGIYAWDESAFRASPPCARLAGIAHTFIPHANLIIGTRLHVYMSVLFHAYPNLFEISNNPSAR
jgi:hypothetical protein